MHHQAVSVCLMKRRSRLIMSLRLSEAQFKALQNRGLSANKNKEVLTPQDYDIQKHIVTTLDRAAVLRDKSPLLVTLSLGLKAIQSDQCKSKPFERVEQALALYWLKNSCPHAFSMTTATPMGGFRPNGAGGQMKGEGAKPGYPDLLMDVPRHNYHGLRIEMKKYSLSAKPSMDQTQWLTMLAKEGYCSVLCRGHQAAIQVFREYLNIPFDSNYADLPKWCIQYY